MAKILIIDDNADSAETLAIAMKLAGHDAEFVTGGAQAFKKIDHFIPDVVLCDINMPDLQGYDVCHKLKADKRLKDTIFLAQTAYGTIDRKLRSIDAGFTHHFVKPLDIGKLVAFINGAMAKIA